MDRHNLRAGQVHAVGGALQSTDGGIAYIAIAYVMQNKFDFALVQNAAGKYPVPGPTSIAAAADAVTTIPAGGTAGISLVDPPASTRRAPRSRTSDSVS